MNAIPLALALALALAACGDNVAAPPVEVGAGGLRALVHADPAQIELLRGDEVVWSTRAGGGLSDDGTPHGFAGVRTATADIQMLYGSFKFEPDVGDDWRGVDSLGDITATATGATFTLLAGGDRVGTGALTLTADGARIRLTADGDTNRLSLATPCAATEHFAGLGGQSFEVDHRGQTVPLWVQEDGIGKERTADDEYAGSVWFLSGRHHSTHTPMPMLLSSRGYAQAIDTDTRAIFALCSEADDVARYEVWSPTLDLHVFLATPAAPTDALRAMIDWVGRPPRPPLAAFAPWLDAVRGQENVSRVANLLRTEGVAASAIWTEDWRGGSVNGTGFALEEDWRVDRDLYPDFEDLAAELEDLGFAFLTYQNTFIDTAADVYDEAVSLGHVMLDQDGEPYLFDGVRFEPTALLDLSSPAAVAWAQDVLAEGVAMGADGWMADFAEWVPVDSVLASGEDPLAVHNRYPVDWARLNRELLGDDGLWFVRAAWLHSQPLVSVVWAGDQQTDFSEGDGMPSVVPIGLGLGVTGFPYFGSDIAGYMSQSTEPTTEELWQRWVTLGALSPVMRTHHGRSIDDNWSWESDAAATAHMRRWTRLHMQLVPYLWGSIGAFDRDGLPLFRLLALAYPDEDWAWTDATQYLLGDRILVAPVLAEGATSRDVQLPPGRWFPLLGGAGQDGGRTITADAAPTEIPAFVPAGAILVLYPDGVETVIPDPGDDREVWLYPGTPAGDAGHWHDDDGPAATPTWTWTGGAEGAPAAATWNGEPIALTTDDDGAVSVDLTGDGTLELDGGDGGTLTIARGLPAAATHVRLLVP